MLSEEALAELEARVGRRFRRRELLTTAFVHVSVAGDRVGDPTAVSNERLEFLGDAVIELLVSRSLFDANPDWDEGALTEARALIVTTDSLARVAGELGLGQWLVLARGEERTGGRERPSNLADTIEAVAGAIYLDGGLTAARRFVEAHILAGVDLTRPPIGARDPKTVLQERLQAAGLPHPTYRAVSTEGPDHRPTFVVEASAGARVLARGRGGSKKLAERDAASKALSELA